MQNLMGLSMQNNPVEWCFMLEYFMDVSISQILSVCFFALEM
jgi:hypothetical protein